MLILVYTLQDMLILVQHYLLHHQWDHENYKSLSVEKRQIKVWRHTIIMVMPLFHYSAQSPVMMMSLPFKVCCVALCSWWTRTEKYFEPSLCTNEVCMAACIAQPTMTELCLVLWSPEQCWHNYCAWALWSCSMHPWTHDFTKVCRNSR